MRVLKRPTCQETIVLTWLLTLKGRRSILFSHTVATGLAKLCPTSTPRPPLKTASLDPLLFAPSTLDPSRLIRWLVFPLSTLLTNYVFWPRNTGINQKRRTVRSVGPLLLYLIDPTKHKSLSISCSCPSRSRTAGPSFVVSMFSPKFTFRCFNHVRSFWVGSKSYRTNIKLRSSYITRGQYCLACSFLFWYSWGVVSCMWITSRRTQVTFDAYSAARLRFISLTWTNLRPQVRQR